MNQWNAVEERRRADDTLRADIAAARSRHSETIAKIAKRERRGRDQQRAEALKRYRRAFALRDAGKTFKEIGAELGVSITRASAMVSQYEVRLERDAKAKAKLEAGSALRASMLKEFEEKSKNKSALEVTDLAKKLISSVALRD